MMKRIAVVATLSLAWNPFVAASRSAPTIMAVSSIPQAYYLDGKRLSNRQPSSSRRSSSEPADDLLRSLNEHNMRAGDSAVLFASAWTRKIREKEAARNAKRKRKTRSYRRPIPIDNGTLKTSPTARLYKEPRNYRPGENPPVNSKLQRINWVAYGLQVLFPAITKWGVKLSDKILAGEDLYRIFTPMFLHGNPLHLLTNSQSLGAVGPQLERIMGSGRYLSVYLVSGIAGNLASAFMTPNPSLGASGAVFGLMGSYLTVLKMNSQAFGSFGEKQMSKLGSCMATNVFLGFMSQRIDNWAHIGGAAAGALFTVAFGPRLELRQRLNGEYFLIDSPLIRFPRLLESLPEKVYKRVSRMKLRLEVNRQLNGLPERPWRRDPQNYVPKDYVPSQDY